jgi:regulator of replication initiation timing
VISRGRYNEYYLYEVTAQDLILKTEATTNYRVGNVLIYPDKKNIGLGCEFARADDVFAAKEYLDGDELQPLAQTRQQEEEIADLRVRIELRDGLLSDLAESLNEQKEKNEQLNDQLIEAQAQLMVDELSRDELVGDLEQISAETHTIETALERTLNEKDALEQELATRITELLDLNLQNDELKRALKPQATEATLANQGVGSAASGAGAAKPSSLSDESAASSAAVAAQQAAPQDEQTLTMPSGRQITIMHQFPTPPKRTAAASFMQLIWNVSRIVIIVVVSLMLLFALSVVATAQANDITYGDALDLLVRSIRDLMP